MTSPRCKACRISGGRDMAQNLPSRASKCVGLFSVGPPCRSQAATQASNWSALTRGWPNKLNARRALLSSAVGASVPENTGCRPSNFPSLLAGLAHVQHLRPRKVKRQRRRGDVVEAAQGHGVRVALPEGVEPAHAEIHRRAREHLPGEVHEHAVAQVACVVQPDQRHPRAQRPAEMLKYPLAAQAAHRVFADRRGGVGFQRAAARRRDEPIDVAGRERHDPAARELAANDGGQVRVHRPGERLLAGRAELHPGEVKNVRGVRQSLHRRLVQQIAANGLDAVPLQLRLEAGRGKARHTDDAPPDAGEVRRAPGHAREARAHLAATPSTMRSPSSRRNVCTTSGVGSLSRSSSCSRFWMVSAIATGKRKWSQRSELGCNHQFSAPKIAVLLGFQAKCVPNARLFFLTRRLSLTVDYEAITLVCSRFAGGSSSPRVAQAGLIAYGALLSG